MLTDVNGVNSDEQVSLEPGVLPRRERVRAATEAEILDTARQLLADGGPSAVTLREVGRRMGITASALYRYFDGRAALLDALIASFFVELTAAVSAPGVRSVPDTAMAGNKRILHDLMAASHAFRNWSLAHPAEFGLMFGPADPEWTNDDCILTAKAGEGFAGVFAGMFARGVDVSKAHDGMLFGGLPPALAELFSRAWVRLLGTVSVEVFQQTAFLSADPDRIFELEMSMCGDLISRELQDLQGGRSTGLVRASH